MPRNTISPKMNLIAAGDVAKKHVKITAVWGRYSCQLMLGRSLLGNEDSSIPVEDVAPNGPWHKGLDLMRNDIENVVEKGVLTPVLELRLSKDDDEDFDKGFVHELSPEILTRGYTVLAA